jgi:hypothetical protein
MPKGKSDSTLSRTRCTAEYLQEPQRLFLAATALTPALLAVAFVPELLGSEVRRAVAVRDVTWPLCGPTQSTKSRNELWDPPTISGVGGNQSWQGIEYPLRHSARPVRACAPGPRRLLRLRGGRGWRLARRSRRIRTSSAAGSSDGDTWWTKLAGGEVDSAVARVPQQRRCRAGPERLRARPSTDLPGRWHLGLIGGLQADRDEVGRMDPGIADRGAAFVDDPIAQRDQPLVLQQHDRGGRVLGDVV